MHNHNDNSSLLMMWMMILCCVLPIVFLTLFSGKAIGAPTWLIFGAMVVFLVVYFWLMKKSHNHSVGSGDNKSSTSSHSNYGCH